MFANVRRGKQGKRRQRIKQASSRQQASGKKPINKQLYGYYKDALLCSIGLLAVPNCCKAHVLSLALWSGCLSCAFKIKKGCVGGRVKFRPPSMCTNRLNSIYLATSSKRGIHNEN
jgi:hypothetical protein